MPALVVGPSESLESISSDRAETQTAGSSSGGSIVMTKSYLPDLHEPWTNGQPEIYVHLATLGPDGNWFWRRCAGDADMAYGYDHYQFDQNNHTWTGEVTLADEIDVDGRQFMFTVWEDDAGRCNNVSSLRPAQDDPPPFDLFFGISANLYATNVCLANPQENWNPWCIGPVGLLYMALGLLPELFEDDWVAVVDDGVTCFETLSGTVRIPLSKPDGSSEGAYIEVDDNFLTRELCALDVSVGGDQTACTIGQPAGDLSAIVNTHGGGYSYEWREDGVLRGTGSGYSIHDRSAGTRHIQLTVTRHHDGQVETATRNVPVEYPPDPFSLSC